MLREAESFVRTVELNSMSAAARSLGITVAAVSTRIQKLEARYGVMLLARNQLGLRPTEVGELFLHHARRILESTEFALAAVTEYRSAPQGVLHISAPITFGRQFLAPIICEFHDRYPAIDTRLRQSDCTTKLLDEDCDVAIALGPLKDGDLIVRALADCPMVLCAAPSYLRRSGLPAEPTALADHDCLAQRIGGCDEREWTLTNADGPVTAPIGGRFATDCGDVLTELALKGKGIVRRPLWEVAEHLQKGCLIEVLPHHRPPSSTLHLLYRGRRMVPLKIKAFSEFVQRRFGGRIAPSLLHANPPRVAAE